MFQDPQEIYSQYIENKIDRSTLISQLISIIHNATIDRQRIESLRCLEILRSDDDEFFKLLENLIISEQSHKVKLYAIEKIGTLFKEKAFKPLKWCYYHDSSFTCIIFAILAIGKIKNNVSRRFLIYELYKNKDFSIPINKLRAFSSAKLSDLLVNLSFRQYFRKRILNSKINIKEGCIKGLDLSSVYNSFYQPNIHNLLPGCLIYLKKLECLNLSFNNLRRIPNIIISIESLKSLILNDNLLTFLPTSMRKLSSLENLSLKKNKFLELSNSIGNLNALKSLDLSNNYLQSLPNSLKQLKNLRRLVLHGNEFKEIPEVIKTLNCLEELDLSLNSIKNLPEWFIELKSLKKIDLGDNKNLKIESNLSLLTQIRKLSLYSTGMIKLPQNIANLENLEEINLHNNRLDSLPRSFRNLSNLKKLDLNWNNFSSLPEWIASVKSLQELNLRGNKLRNIPESIENLPNLRRIDLKYNKIYSKSRKVEILAKRGISVFI